MLTIKKHPLSTKAALFGAVAFLVGFTGTGVYIDRARQHENLAFDRVEAVLGVSDTRAAQQGTPTNETQNTASSQETASSEAMIGDDVEVVPMQPVTTNNRVGSSSPAPTPLASSTPTPTVEPGRGAGPSAESSAPTEPTVIDALQGSCLVQNCVVTTVQDAAESLLGQ